MAKITIPAIEQSSENLESLSATNPYLSADGLVNVAALNKLNTRIAAANKKIGGATLVRGVMKPTKRESPIFYSAKPLVPYSASLDKKNDHKYKTVRGQQIKSRTKMPAEGARTRMSIVLQGTFVGIEDKALLAEIRKATTAIGSHNKKAEKVVGKVKVEKTKIRDAANKEFDANVDAVKAILLAGGIKEANIVVGTSMFGKVVHVKLPNGGVVSIGKSDETKLRAAKKTAAAPAAPAAAAKPARTPRAAAKPTRTVKKVAAPARKPAARRPTAK